MTPAFLKLGGKFIGLRHLVFALPNAPAAGGKLFFSETGEYYHELDTEEWRRFNGYLEAQAATGLVVDLDRFRREVA